MRDSGEEGRTNTTHLGRRCLAQSLAWTVCCLTNDKDSGFLFCHLSSDGTGGDVILILKIINYTVCLLMSYNLVFCFMVACELSLTENSISVLWRHAVILRGQVF